MNSHGSVLNQFLSLLKYMDNYRSVVSILLGGSFIKEDTSNEKDIDLMVYCKDNMGKKLLTEIKTKITDKNTQKLFDIKIIELSSLKEINNSNYAAYFYHFTKNSQLIEGKDLRDSFKTNDAILFQLLNKNIEEVDKIRDIFYLYNQKVFAEIILFKTLKTITIIGELLGFQIDRKTLTSEEMMFRIYGNTLYNIKKKVKKARTWLSIYEPKGKKGIFGSEQVFIKMKKKASITDISNTSFDSLLQKTRFLSQEILELLES